MDDLGVRSLSFAEALASVTRLAERVDHVAAALRKLREPEAAAVVAELGKDADRAAAAICALLVCVPPLDRLVRDPPANVESVTVTQVISLR